MFTQITIEKTRGEPYDVTRNHMVPP
eukprot:SAG22_NODE_6268_length_877_cov_1.128535_2_plen_25_part_01